jgi:hypothetical protein
MANPTTNYGFVMPTSTDLVTDLPADFDVFGQAVDTQMLTNANAAIAKTIVDAKGDIIAATASDTVSRLAVGANNTVLTADSTTATGLKWATPTSATGFSLIATGSYSGVSSVSLATDSFTTTYDNYRLVVNVSSATADNYFQLRLRAAGADNTTSNYTAQYLQASQTADTTSPNSSGTTTAFGRMGYVFTSQPAYASYDIYSPKATAKTFVTGTFGGASTNTLFTGGLFNATTSFDSISFFPGAGNISGTYSLYGYNK